MQALRKLLFPFSLIYALIVRVRNILFDIGVFKSKTYRTPTICVGNLSVGGTGKTPMIELLIRIFGDDNRTAVLSRGYRRKSKGFVLAGKDTKVLEIGDEPFQIHKKFPKVTIAVDADRRNGMTQLEDHVKPDIILLDDAFQHRKVKAGFYLLLTSFDNLYMNDWYLPTGNLRDSKKEAKRAHIIVVTKCPIDMTQQKSKVILGQIKPLERQKVLFASLEYSPILRSKWGNKDFSFLEHQQFTLVTGIANPDPLVTYLTSKGLRFEHLSYKDHHNFTEKEIGELKQKQIILTTEKDYVRLNEHLQDIFYVEILHTFLFGGQSVLEEELNEFMKTSS